jgi:hypothetical protein
MEEQQELCEIVNYNSVSYGLVLSAPGSYRYEMLLISSSTHRFFYYFIPPILHFLPVFI